MRYVWQHEHIGRKSRVCAPLLHHMSFDKTQLQGILNETMTAAGPPPVFKQLQPMAVQCLSRQMCLRIYQLSGASGMSGLL